MFMGEYNHTIDAKGRLIVPSKFREQLGDEFVVTKGLDGCLFVYDNTEWKKFEMTYTATGTGSVTFKLNSAGTLYLANIKLELGNKATDWTPAPEDGIAKVDVEYYLSTSSTSLAGGSWTTIAPAWVNGKYMWSRTVTIDGAGNKTYSPNQNGVCITGAKGATGAQGPKGDTGAQGPKGDKGTTGATGAAGKGIKSTSVTYQAGTTGVAVPTGTWSTTIPSTSASKPFLWSRTIITYTDNTTSTTYSVGSTADSVQVGGRNLVLNSTNLSKWTMEPGISISKEDEWFKVLDSSHSNQRWGIYTDIAVEPNTTYTLSVYCKNGNKVPYVGGGPMSKSSMSFGTNWAVLNAENGIRFITTITTGSSDNIWRFYLCVNPNATGQYVYFKLPKLEKGNIATDWTPAPEDLIKSITEANTAIEKTDEKISMKASVDSVTEISNRANEIEGMLSEAKTTIARHEESIQMLTSDEFTVKFTNLVQQITSVDGKFEQYKEKMDNWLRFDKNGNLIIGSTRVPGQPAYEIMISKNRISFLLNDIEVAYISDDEMHINKSTVMESITIGRENQKFIWEMRGNGNLGLVWR